MKDPQILFCDFENLPGELTRIPNWHWWKSKQKDNGKVGKIPCNETGYPADCNKRENLYPFKHVLDKLIESELNKVDGKRKLDGASFQLNESAYTCVDIDSLDEWDQKELSKFLRPFLKIGAYIESSPSMNGLHIWLKGKKPKRMGCSDSRYFGGRVEVYDSRKSLTMTGRYHPNYRAGQIPDGTKLIEQMFKPLLRSEPASLPANSFNNEFNDDIVIRNCRETYPEFGHWFDSGSGYDTRSPSQEDWAFIRQVLYYSKNNKDQALRIYKQSALYQERQMQWDRTSYRDGTLTKASESMKGFYTGPGLIKKARAKK